MACTVFHKWSTTTPRVNESFEKLLNLMHLPNPTPDTESYRTANGGSDRKLKSAGTYTHTSTHTHAHTHTTLTTPKPGPGPDPDPDPDPDSDPDPVPDAEPDPVKDASWQFKPSLTSMVSAARKNSQLELDYDSEREDTARDQGINFTHKKQQPSSDSSTCPIFKAFQANRAA